MFLSNFRLKTAVQTVLWNVREVIDYPYLHPTRELERIALAETVEYIQSLPELPPSFPTARQLLTFAIRRAPAVGAIVELGVYKGATIRFIARTVGPSRQVHGFDTFAGLPTRWTGNSAMFDAGGKLPTVPGNVALHVGLFAETVPSWTASAATPVAFVHVDCDLYESTLSGLGALGPCITNGTVIVFDEYFNYPGWQRHEFRAFQELVKEHRWTYTYIGYSRIQVAVRIGAADTDRSELQLGPPDRDRRT
jgi:hypothetical protein